MFDQADYSVYTTTWSFLSRNITNETCSLAVTQPGEATLGHSRSVMERVIWSFLLILIILASLIGNVLVLACVHLHHQLREENSSMFIVNLSVADMVNAAVVMVSSLHALATDKWLLGPAWCDIVCGTNYTMIIVSMFTLCFVSLDRYIAVKHALHYHARVTRTKIYLLLGYAWGIGFCFGLVPILYQWIRYDYWEAVCAIVWHEDRKRVLLFVTVGFTLCFVMPSVILVIAYSKADLSTERRGEIFFSDMASGITNYLMKNKYVETAVQTGEGEIPGVPGCLKHSTMIWDEIQNAKREKGELHVIWLDLANAYGSVPHQMLCIALKTYHVPENITEMLMQYFSGFSLRFSTKSLMTRWIDLQVGIAMGCTISPILFVMAMQVILDAADDYAHGPRLSAGRELPPLKAFMDDTTIPTPEESDARSVLLRLDDLIHWCRMNFKPKKSRSLSIIKGKVAETRFMVSGQAIPTVSEEPVKSLGP